MTKRLPPWRQCRRSKRQGCLIVAEPAQIPGRPVQNRGCGRPSSALPAATPAGAATIGPADRARRRQGRRRHGRGRGAALPRRPRPAGGPDRGPRGHPPRLCAPDPAHTRDRSRAPGPRCRRPRRDAARRSRSPIPPGPTISSLVLMSGGASANWIAPAAGLSLVEKQALTRALLASGASISEINGVRKHLSRIKGGRLAQRISPARVVTIAISDVPGDDPAVIGSGPTVADPTTLADARATSRAIASTCRTAVTRALADPAQRNAEARRRRVRKFVIRAGVASGRHVRQGRGCGARRRLRLHPARRQGRGRGARRRRRARAARAWRCARRAGAP